MNQLRNFAFRILCFVCFFVDIMVVFGTALHHGIWQRKEHVALQKVFISRIEDPLQKFGLCLVLEAQNKIQVLLFLTLHHDVRCDPFSDAGSCHGGKGSH